MVYRSRGPVKRGRVSLVDLTRQMTCPFQGEVGGRRQSFGQTLLKGGDLEASLGFVARHTSLGRQHGMRDI